MADNENPFLAGLEVPKEENPFLVGLDVPSDPPASVKPLRSEPVTEVERFIFQNLFDTDKKRRAAYAKSIGLELDPNDDNKFRALGSKEEFTGEIDPGFGTAYKKGGLIGAAKELGKDVLTDMAFDYGIGGLSALAAGKAATIGGAIGGPIGIGVGAILGGFGGALAGEEIKEFAGDLLLDEDIPADQRQQIFYATLNALGPVIMKQAGNLAQSGAKTFLQLRKNAIKQAVKQGGQLSEEAIEKAIQKPELFQPEVVKGGMERLDEFYRNFFGVSPDEADIVKAVKEMADGTPKGVIGKYLEPIYAKRNRALAELNNNRAADFSLGELKMPIEQKILELKSKPFLSVDEKDALSVLQEQLKEVDSYAKTLLPKGVNSEAQDIANIRVPFGTGQDFLKSFQSKAFDKTTKSQNPIVNQTANRLRTEIVQSKGSQVSPEFADAQAKISKAMDVFEQTAKVLKPKQIRQSFILSPESDRLTTQRALRQIDEITGQDFTKQFEKGALQAQFEQFYSQAVPKGSSEVNTAIVSGAAKGAVKGGLGGAAVSGITGGVIPLAASVPGGAILGGIRGGMQAATMSKPGEALKALGKLSQREQFLDFIGQQAARGADSGLGSSVLRAVTEEAAPQSLREAIVPEREEENPFLKGL
jgi:hypothetical protein